MFARTMLGVSAAALIGWSALAQLTDEPDADAPEAAAADAAEGAMEDSDPFGIDAFEDAGPTSAPGDYAVLRGLDKVTATTRDFTARIGEEVTFGSLTIQVHYCRRRPPEEPPETFVALDIYDRVAEGVAATGGADARREQIFSGWMFASDPALNPLEHPVFDVWPIGCRGDDEPPPENIARREVNTEDLGDDAPIEPPTGE